MLNYKFPCFVRLAHRSPLSTFAACKARDTLAKALYADLFRFIVAHINQTFKFDHGTSQNTSIQSISILDIAGFGELISKFKFKSI